MYVARSLEAFPHSTPLSALNAGMDALARALPLGSPLMLLCTQRISERLLQLLAPAGPPTTTMMLPSALDLAKLLAHILTVADLQVSAPFQKLAAGNLSPAAAFDLFMMNSLRRLLRWVLCTSSTGLCQHHSDEPTAAASDSIANPQSDQSYANAAGSA